MAVEHRLSARIKTTIELSIRYSNSNSVETTAVARNLSLEGLFLEGLFPNIKPHTFIEIRFNIKEDFFLQRAMVVHCSQRRIGVMLARPQPELYRRALLIFPHS